MMTTVPHVTSGLGLKKFQAVGFLLTRVYVYTYIVCLVFIIFIIFTTTATAAATTTTTTNNNNNYNNSSNNTKEQLHFISISVQKHLH